ncbi:MAG: hypothetical protein FGM57_02275 [Candidatus Taylorbacteria bacterium]|nr:hypothetical protein [Candidatus Taylorbacteria bacterium]
MRPIKIIARKNKIIKQNIDSVIESRVFEDAVNWFRKKYKIKTIGEDTKRKFEAQDVDEYGYYPWHKDIHEALRRASLDHQWYLIFFDYVMTGNYDPVLDPEGVTIFEDDFNTVRGKKKDYYIRIHPMTTKRDLIDAYTYVHKEINGKRVTKRRFAKNFERDKDVFYLFRQGLRPAQIAVEIEKKYSDPNFSISNVYRIISQHSKKIKGEKKFKA